MTNPDAPTVLYRFYAADGALLYVGISADFPRRVAGHRRKPWWRERARTTIEVHPTRRAALDAERAAIVTENPRYNIAGRGATVPVWPPVSYRPDGTPVVTPLSVSVDHRGVRSVRIHCPLCGHVHSHGWPQGDDKPGPRSPHCRLRPLGPAGYVIEALP